MAAHGLDDQHAAGTSAADYGADDAGRWYVPDSVRGISGSPQWTAWCEIMTDGRTGRPTDGQTERSCCRESIPPESLLGWRTTSACWHTRLYEANATVSVRPTSRAECWPVGPDQERCRVIAISLTIARFSTIICPGLHTAIHLP